MSNFNTFATKATEDAAYLTERTKQESKTAQEVTHSNTSPYVKQARGSVQDTSASIQNNASEAGTQARDALNEFERQASAQTNAAADEGQKDVDAVKEGGAGYVAQAKELAGNAIEGAQKYVSSAVGKSNPTDPHAPQGDIATSLQSTANAAYETTRGYLASAQEVVQPHVQNAQEAAQPYLDRAQAIVQPQVDAAVATAQPYVAKARSTLDSVIGSGSQNNVDNVNNNPNDPKV